MKLTALSASGDEAILHVYKAGEIFGELCFSAAVQSYGATALESSEILEVSAARVIVSLRARPELVSDVLTQRSERVAVAYGGIHAFLSGRSPHESRASCSVWSRLSRQPPRGWGWPMPSPSVGV